MSSASVTLAPCSNDDLGVHGFAPLLVRNPEHGDLEHRRVGGQRVLDLGRVDVLAARDDHVLGPVDDEDVPAVVDRRQVATAVPAVGREGPRRLVGAVPVPGHDVRAADHDLADLADLADGAVRPTDLDVDADARRAAAGEPSQRIGVAGQAEPGGRGPRAGRRAATPRSCRSTARSRTAARRGPAASSATGIGDAA